MKVEVACYCHTRGALLGLSTCCAAFCLVLRCERNDTPMRDE